jgi:hypothetical protein
MPLKLAPKHTGPRNKNETLQKYDPDRVHSSALPSAMEHTADTPIAITRIRACGASSGSVAKVTAKTSYSDDDRRLLSGIASQAIASS